MNSKYRHLFAIICFMFFILAGCSQEQVPSTKQARLIAAENMELQEKINKLNEQIDKLKEQHKAELDKQKQLNIEYQEEIENLKEASQRNVREAAQDVLDNVLEDNSQLRKENEQLKNWLETQTKQIQQLERMLSEAPE